MQERRLFPRYSFASPALIRGGTGGAYEAQATEISLGGISLVLQRKAVVALGQGGLLLGVGDWLKLTLGAEGGMDQGQLQLSVTVRGVRRLSRDRYLVAMTFDQPTEGQLALIAERVERARARHLKV